jgi:hypothetical protein
MKTYYPTTEEFGTNPLIYFDKLFKQGAEQYGVVKIVPPKEFNPPLAFDQFSN